jgi:predicted nucleic acid-binding protein
MAIEILVDSNVYIDLMKRSLDPIRVLGEWAGTSDLVTCGMVRLEVLRGLKHPKAFQRISSFMDTMINVRTHAAFWPDATDLAWQLDRQGKVIPGTDLIIAAYALRTSAAVLTSDVHFGLIDGLRVIAPPAEWFS